MYSGTLTYISLSTTLKERPAYMAGTHAMWGIGTVLGPVVSESSDLGSYKSNDLTGTFGRLAGHSPRVVQPGVG